MITIEKKYTTKAKASGGKNARIVSEDGLINLEYRPPKELQGNGIEGQHTNPEQLLAAGYAGCMSSSIQLAAEKLQIKVDPKQIEVTAIVNMGDDTSGSGFGYTIDLETNIKQLDQQNKQKIIETAHKECPYYKAMRGNIDVKVTVK